MPKSVKALPIIAWYLSTMARGVVPSFIARMVMAAPCSSLPQTNSTSLPRARRQRT